MTEPLHKLLGFVPTETVFAPGPCALCGRNPAVGFASIGDDWYCHGDFDPEPTCYMRAQHALAARKGEL